MEPTSVDPTNLEAARPNPAQDIPIQLRLYVARSTPKSVRATSNLTAALAALSNKIARPDFEVIDVFSEPRRAIKDSVIVTPMLIGLSAGKRVVLLGDLANSAQLEGVLLDLLAQPPTSPVA